ncbi:DUF6907 domain-containing protein [Streptomyces sp. NPDC090077]|uniref:DUF6907 domain-containing protein n=1 Tax=Streptomyces sp. NPDC090077 TaxID=3365938 RepID=UPI0038217677
MTTTRVVPAVINGCTCFVECPSWCVIDHVSRPNRFLEDLWHSGTFAGLMAPSMGRDPEVTLLARLGMDPYSRNADRRSPFVNVDDGGEGLDMTPSQAFEYADNLVAFADQIRAMARTAAGVAR